MPRGRPMYEQPKTLPAYRRAPTRVQSGQTPVHNSSAHSSTVPAPQRDTRLVGHLAALRSATEAVRQAAEDRAQQAELDAALKQIGTRIHEVSAVSDRAAGVLPSVPSAGGRPLRELHQQAHALAGRLLVVAAAQQDTATAMLACRRMDAHATALSTLAVG
ncbi:MULTISPECIES: hypothetical protein [Streptacidiphilus]|uniref:Uncharacterized protein n=1 Tax=Streptacidiphilus cavernicola TaxID=3342716 RepID=A0ABV6UHA2_9ACTN|nr:hypothetical protein [Streptacidiphilus jeojiense]